jgi:hypothetical protein
MKPGTSFSLISAVFILGLVILNGCLLKQNISYKLKNRELILQNDSLMAVSIHLNKKIGKNKTDTLLTQQPYKSSSKRKKG